MHNIFLKRERVLMTNWADELIPEYKQGRKDLKIMKHELTDDDLENLDKTHINSMVDSMSFSIEWMETGRQPGVYRGIDKKNAYRPKQYDDMDVIPDITEQLEKERESLYMSPEQRKSLLHLFKTFSDRERQCFIMYEAEQMSMKEIAVKLGISKATVQVYIKRARDKVEEIA